MRNAAREAALNMIFAQHFNTDCMDSLRKKIFKQFGIEKEEDVPYFHKTSEDPSYSLQVATKAYENEGRIRVRLGKTDLTNLSLEYTFKRENNVLFLFGEYLATKTMEASLIKDTLVLSKNIEEPTVYYIDYNQDVLLSSKDTVIKRVAKHWDAKIVRGLDSDIENLFDDISDLIEQRRKREVSLLYPVSTGGRSHFIGTILDYLRN